MDVGNKRRVIASRGLSRGGNQSATADSHTIQSDTADLRRLTAIIEREDDGYVALCPEYDIASEGATIEESRENLIEALTLFFECAEASEKKRRYRPEVLVTQVEVKVA